MPEWPECPDCGGRHPNADHLLAVALKEAPAEGGSLPLFLDLPDMALVVVGLKVMAAEFADEPMGERALEVMAQVSRGIAGATG